MKDLIEYFKKTKGEDKGKIIEKFLKDEEEREGRDARAIPEGNFLGFGTSVMDFTVTTGASFF